MAKRLSCKRVAKILAHPKMSARALADMLNIGVNRVYYHRNKVVRGRKLSNLVLHESKKQLPVKKFCSYCGMAL